MNCPFEEDVSALFDDELAPGDAARVRAHIESCATCGALLSDFTRIRETLLSPAPRRPFWRRTVAVPLPAAAVFVLAFLLISFFAFRHPAAQTGGDIFAPYDGGGRAVIKVVKR
jgi:hypothetical protein